jgi:hypothetical protein
LKTHIASGPTELAWAKFGVLASSNTGRLAFLQPFLPRGFPVGDPDRSILREKVGDSADLFDALFDESGQTWGLFGHGLDVRRFLLDVDIRGEIAAIEWPEEAIFVLTKSGELFVLTLQTVPSFIDDFSTVAVTIVQRLSFAGEVCLVCNVWGTFVVGEADAWSVGDDIERVKGERFPVTDAAVSRRILELAKRGKALQEREGRVRAQIIDIMEKLETLDLEAEQKRAEELKKVLADVKALNRFHKAETSRGRFFLES